MQIVRRIGERKEKLKRNFFNEKRKTFSFVIANFFLKEYNINCSGNLVFQGKKSLCYSIFASWYAGVEEKWDIR